MHGYDLTDLAPGTPGRASTFDATIPGVFEVELHDAGTVLLSLQVRDPARSPSTALGHEDERQRGRRPRPRGRVADGPADPARVRALRRGRGDPAQLRRPAAVLADPAAGRAGLGAPAARRPAAARGRRPRSGAAAPGGCAGASPPSWSPSRCRRPQDTDRNLAPVGPLRDLLGRAGPAQPAARPGLAGGQPAAAAAPRPARGPAAPAARAARCRLWGCGRPPGRCWSSSGWSSSTRAGRSRPRWRSSCSATPSSTSASRCGSARAGSPTATASRPTRR